MKKTNKHIITILIVLVTIGFSACQTDLLSPTPKTSVLTSDVFKTPQRIDQQVNGIYKATKSGNFLGSRYLIYNDIRAEDFINRLTNGVTGYQTWNHTLVESTNEVVNTWGAAYAAINQANVFLDGLSANAASFVPPAFAADYVTTKVPQFQAEARFLRAISYYYLLQLYARPYIDGNGSKPGLPLRLKGEKDFTGNDLARSTVAQVYDQILTDLNFAEQNLLSTNASSGDLNVVRAHKNAAIAFKVRVYLTMGKYAEVITEANKIVSATAPFKASTGVSHQLAATIASVFATPQQTTESIFSFPFTTLDPPGTQNQLGYYYLPSTAGGNGEYYLNANGILANTNWKSTDARRALTVVSGGNRYLTKFATVSPYTDNSPVIRYAEVLLSLAEARVRTTNTLDAQAIALLNAVRGRSDATTIFTVADFATTDDLVAAILRERRIEFLGEGLRSIDLMRLNQTIPGKATVAAVAPTDPNYVWPIPVSELSTNALMVRN